jgi:hypothetical protein
MKNGREGIKWEKERREYLSVDFVDGTKISTQLKLSLRTQK